MATCLDKSTKEKPYRAGVCQQMVSYFSASSCGTVWTKCNGRFKKGICNRCGAAQPEAK